MEHEKITVIDLFCGAGGFSTGFLATGQFDIKYSIDIDERMKETYEYNHPHTEFILHDIAKNIPKYLLEKEFDVIIGSPPCQGFSKAPGKRDFYSPKNRLLHGFIKWVVELNPKIALMENVEGITNIRKPLKKNQDRNDSQSTEFDFNRKISNQQQVFNFMKNLSTEIEGLGFSFKSTILDCKDFGVPQDRNRFFGLITNNSFRKNIGFPAPTHLQKGFTTLEMFYDPPIERFYQTTVKEALLGLPKLNPNTINHEDIPIPLEKNLNKQTTPYEKFVFDSQSVTKHNARFPKKKEHLKIMRKIPQNYQYRSDRRGKNNIGVWDVYKDELSEVEQSLLKDIVSLRIKKDIKTKEGEYSEGFVPLNYLEDYDPAVVKSLIKKNFLKYSIKCSLSDHAKLLINTRNSDQTQNIKEEHKKISLEDFRKVLEIGKRIEDNEIANFIPTYNLNHSSKELKRLEHLNLVNLSENKNEVDITAKAGNRGSFYRISLNSFSRTLTTSFTNFRELVHPLQDRGLSLREGARLMSFPDSFEFFGNFTHISKQIGNAVPPLLAYNIAKAISEGFLREY